MEEGEPKRRSRAPDGTGKAGGEICGYAVARVLRAGSTFLAAAPAGRRVVLKMVDADCLLRGQLHPNIRDRLGRVREAASLAVANLRGVEKDGRDGRGVFMVWEYVEGERLDDALASGEMPAGQMLMIAREAMLAAGSLHNLGLVHGALHEGNIFYRRLAGRDRQVVLTHVSPLLYNDPAEDVQSLIAALRRIIEQRGESESAFGRMLSDPSSGTLSMEELATRVGRLIAAPVQAGGGAEGLTEGLEIPRSGLKHDWGYRRAAVGAAIGMAMAGVALYLIVREAF